MKTKETKTQGSTEETQGSEKGAVQAEPVRKTVEEWAGEKETDTVILEGVKVFARWKTGRSVTEGEYDAAVKAFDAAPADGRK